MRIYLVFLILATSSAQAKDISIFDVRKNLALADSDPVYRDFYLNQGAEAGLKVGMVVNVMRKTPLYDSYQNRAVGDLEVVVGRIRVIHVQANLAVARLFEELKRDDLPLLEDFFVMVGDRIDLASATMSPKSKKNVAENEVVEPNRVAEPSQVAAASAVTTVTAAPDAPGAPVVVEQ